MTYSSLGVVKLTKAEKDKIVRDYLPRIKVWAIRAKSGLPESVDIDELYSAASLGLIECLDKFDKSRNTTFNTYVEHRVKGAILDALRGLDFLSRGARGKVKSVESAQDELRQALGRAPTIKEIASHLDIDEDDVYKIYHLQTADKPVSLDDAVGDDSNGSTLVDFLQSAGLTPEDEIIQQKTTERLAMEIDKLQEKERIVVSLYYYEELTMKEIAAVLDITESRVSQIHTSAVQKMKKRLKDFV